MSFLRNILSLPRPIFRRAERGEQMSTENNAHPPQVPDLTHGEWMLALLGADGCQPIRGKTVFVKELFVLGKEIAPQIEKKFDFFASKYGPYSAHFEPS